MKLEDSVSIDQLVDLLSGTMVVAFNTTAEEVQVLLCGCLKR